MNIEDQMLVFHEPDCCGLITSKPDGRLICAECGSTVGHIPPRIVEQICSLVDKFRKSA